MKGIRSRGWLLVPALSLAVAACGDSTGPGFGTGQLTAELAVTPDHIHSYQTTVTFTVSVVDPNGDPVTDFDVLQVERRKVGAATYSVMEATLVGVFYVVDHVFEGSGEYDIRVTGLRASDTDLVVLHEETAPLDVVKAHEDVAGYKVEVEPNPAHIHAGNTAAVQFWVLDDADDTPITGLTPKIFVVESVLGETEYDAIEGADGLYYHDHVFTDIGPTELGIRLSSDPADEWALEIEVHAPH